MEQISGSPCRRCADKGYIIVVCYALGVVSCPDCGNPNDRTGQTYGWRYGPSGEVIVEKKSVVTKE